MRTNALFRSFIDSFKSIMLKLSEKRLEFCLVEVNFQKRENISFVMDTKSFSIWQPRNNVLESLFVGIVQQGVEFLRKRPGLLPLL